MSVGEWYVLGAPFWGVREAMTRRFSQSIILYTAVNYVMDRTWGAFRLTYLEVPSMSSATAIPRPCIHDAKGYFQWNKKPLRGRATAVESCWVIL